MKHQRRQKFDLVKREADGKIVKWETKRLSELGILPEGITTPDGRVLPAFDHEVEVVTGVYNNRREVFAR